MIKKYMIVLAIETSCDETAIALIKKDKNFKILSNIVASQVEIHKPFGGVYPTLAKREHERNLVPILKKALKESNFLVNGLRGKHTRFLAKPGFLNAKLQSKIQKLKGILEREKFLFNQLKNFLLKYKKLEINLIAVTVGPGLEPCLWTGVSFAKALGFFWKLPLIPINHLEGHILVNWFTPIYESPKSKILNPKQIEFPAICLVVSGGHTQLVLMRDIRKYKIIGETRDDAAGECFDKTARILGLGYPGGPEIEQLAAQLKPNGGHQIKLPRPMLHQKNYDFSFSGLKTAVLYDFKKRGKKERKSKKYIQEMAHEIQQAICDVLVEKTIKAVKAFRAKTIILGGGVSANTELRKRFKIYSSKSKINFLVPPKNFCTDNAAMIGITAFYHLDEKKNWKEIEAKANLRL